VCFDLARHDIFGPFAQSNTRNCPKISPAHRSVSRFRRRVEVSDILRRFLLRVSDILRRSAVMNWAATRPTRTFPTPLPSLQ
jgi:hypothetical protein